MIKLGDLEIHVLSDGFFRLDGGAMFGIVPKPAWERVAPCDHHNRVLLGLNPLLIRTGRANVVVDSGIGERRDAKFEEAYEVRKTSTLPGSLAALGVAPEDIDFVVPSHLHFDHAGWLTTRQGGGDFAPTFPRAKYVVQEGTWEEALDANPRTKGSYIHTDFLPLEKGGRLKLIRGDEEIAPGVRVHHTGGHVRHHQITFFESKGRKGVYWGDLLPTAAHVKPAWVMGYDLDPAGVASQKERLIKQAVEEQWLCAFDHDPKTPLAYFRRGEKGVIVEAAT